MKPAAALALVAVEEGARVGKVPFYGRGQQGQLGRGRDAAQRHGAVSFVRAKLRGADLAFAHVASLPDMGKRGKEAAPALIDSAPRPTAQQR